MTEELIEMGNVNNLTIGAALVVCGWIAVGGVKNWMNTHMINVYTEPGYTLWNVVGAVLFLSMAVIAVATALASVPDDHCN
jgi:hypothetical protein